MSVWNGLFGRDDGRNAEYLELFPGLVSFRAGFERTHLNACFRMGWNAMLGQFGLQLLGVIHVAEYAKLHLECLGRSSLGGFGRLRRFCWPG